MDGPHVTSVGLSRCNLNAQQLGALLALTPQLQHLALESMDGLDSLSFLSPLSGSLRSLSLAMCDSRMSLLPKHWKVCARAASWCLCVFFTHSAHRSLRTFCYSPSDPQVE